MTGGQVSAILPSKRSSVRLLGACLASLAAYHTEHPTPSAGTTNLPPHFSASSSRAFVSLDESFRLCLWALFSARCNSSAPLGAGCGG